MSGNVLPDFHSFPLSFAPLTNDSSACMVSLMTAEMHSTLLIYQGRDFIQCVHWSLLLAIEIPVFCRKSVMVRKMHQSQKPRGCTQDPAQVTSSPGVTAWGQCSLKVLTESRLVALPLCDHLDENPTAAQLSWTLHGISHTQSCSNIGQTGYK